MKTKTVRTRIEPKLEVNHGIPFDIRIPNNATLKTFKDTDKRKNLTRYKDAKDMFKKLGM